jgi:hypothetical protein
MERHASTESPVAQSIDAATLELLSAWREQDATDDPDAIREAQRQLDEFKLLMNESRTLAEEPPLFP